MRGIKAYLIIFNVLLTVHRGMTCTNKMPYFLLIYFDIKPLHVSSRLAAHHQGDQLCVHNSWYSQHNS